ncbi:MAG: Maf family protein [Candidatus Omnitrophota bacterium]
MKKIILASQSPRRKELFKKLGFRFSVINSKINESQKVYISPEHHAIVLAVSKAKAVARNAANSLVIGADTIVVYNNKIFGKPKNTADAKHILSTLSDTKHYVCTALAVIDTQTGKTIVDIEKSIISTRKLTAKQIDKLSLKNHDKAGAYAVQESEDLLVKKIDGDFYNVVGLPLNKLKKILNNFRD